MEIEIQRNVEYPDVATNTPIPVLHQQFSSRNAVFSVKTSAHSFFKNSAVSLRVWPIGLDINTDEARAIGRALINAADHFCSIPEE